MLFDSFLDEMQKISGVELNLYGYKSDPTLSPERREELEAAVEDYYKRGNPKSLGPAPLDAFETVRALRTGPKDETSGKLTARILGDYGSVRDLDTDEAYADKPYSRYLDDDKLDRIVEIYKRQMNRFGPEAARQDSDAKYHQMFLDRASQLKKNPKAKGYRLEWG